MNGTSRPSLLDNPPRASAYTQPRLRNVVNIQVANLTPFPTRDAAAHALSQPTEQAQFDIHGHLNDDLDVTLSRRSRKISANTIRSLRSHRSDEALDDSAQPFRRQRTSSKAAQSPTRFPQSGSTPGVLANSRRRTSSKVSFSQVPSSPLVVSSSSSTFLDSSQGGLEKIINSRLVETFIAITVPASSAIRSNTFPPTKEKMNHTTSHGRAPSTSVLQASWTNGHNSAEPLSSDIEEPQETPPPIPSYLSPPHRPSTNPSFPVDPRYDFGPWSELSSTTFHVSLYAKSTVNNSPKGKEKVTDNIDWHNLAEWDVDLDNVVPMSEEDNTSIPVNSLIITLNPGHQVYYVPTSGVPSPLGYSSDSDNRPNSPEVGISRESSTSGELLEQKQTLSRTASWQDLFKLVTLQTCIADNEQSLKSIVDNINRTLLGDTLTPLQREVSERQEFVSILSDDEQSVQETCSKLRNELRSRRQLLEQRRQALLTARQCLEEERIWLQEVASQVLLQRQLLEALRRRFAPTRTTLISTLASIYPIDLVSPPDLLFTILDVPLPIPILSNEPAPPLALANHPSVTPDAVATALGYAAHVVQLLANYLSQDLIYPLTCMGSSSMIKDGISTMVGPRLFPLFSKNVDTYRFEYGVYLLNKNIEIMMADRELRAIDMRHTLPNLKNLLLTLTSGEAALLKPTPVPSSPASIASDFSTKVNTTPRASATTSTTLTEDVEPEDGLPSSGVSTPTATRRRPFLSVGLAPLAGLLRRHPSSSTQPNGDAHDPPGTSTEGDEDDDRRTLRGVKMVDSEPTDKVQNGTNSVEKHSSLKGGNRAPPADALVADV